MTFSGTVLVHATIETLRISIPTVIEAAVGRAPIDVHSARLTSWTARLLEHVDVKLEVHGLENLSRDASYVIMSNHESLYDVPVIFQAIPKPIRMIAKKEIFRVPIWGKAMRASRFVPIDRGNRTSAIESLTEARRAIDDGISVWIAPEGTRSRTGELGRFKSGGFHLAIGARAQILPVSIIGTRNILPANTYDVQRGVQVVVRIGEPIDAARFGRERRAALSDHVRNVILAGRDGLPAPRLPRLDDARSGTREARAIV